MFILKIFLIKDYSDNLHYFDIIKILFKEA